MHVDSEEDVRPARVERAARTARARAVRQVRPAGEADGQPLQPALPVAGVDQAVPEELAGKRRGLIIAVDPGTVESAFVVLDVHGQPARHGKHANGDLRDHLRDWACACPGAELVVEMIASYGMPVGREVFETCVWIGRFIEAWVAAGGVHALMYRREVKLHLCGQARAKDPNVRQALLDRFGPGKERAVGTKKQPGPLYGIAGDEWSALAVAVTHADGGRR